MDAIFDLIANMAIGLGTISMLLCLKLSANDRGMPYSILSQQFLLESFKTIKRKNAVN